MWFISEKLYNITNIVNVYEYGWIFGYQACINAYNLFWYK